MTLAAPAVAASPRADSLSYDLAPQALALAMFAICAFSPAIFNDSDTWSHIATGDWILANRAVPHVDPFTFSFAGKPWTAHEWLSEVLLALAYKAGGYIGVALLTGFAAGAAMFVVTRAAARHLGGPALAAVGGLALLLIAPSLLARPHILALPIFALWTEALFLARERDRAPPLAVSLLMVLWANLHGGFAFGLALIAPLALEAVFTGKAAAARQWALFALVSVTAALVTPFGVEGLLFPVRLLGLGALKQIGEWGPETFAHVNALEAVLLGLIGVALTRPVRLAPLRLAMLLGLLYLSLAHARHEMLLAVVAPMLLARPLAEALNAPPTPARFEARAAIGGLVAIGLALCVGRAFLPPPVNPEFASTQAALAALPAGDKEKPLLNGYAFGGYLIFQGVKPYVDGRADMFGDAFLREYAPIARGDREALTTMLAREKIGWTLFAPEQGAVAAMDAMPGWKRIYADPRVVAHIRVD